jgi:hypothetical protein
MTNSAARAPWFFARPRVPALLALVTAMACPQAASAESVPPDFHAGLEPSRRPASAPMLIEPPRGADWRERALHGIGEPAAGLRFIKDQGGWYTPFTLPGMTERYDLRGWHQRPAQP